MFYKQNIVIDFFEATKIQSPPSMTPTTVKHLVLKNIENAYVWSLVKDVVPNYLFTTKHCHIDENTADAITTLSQLNNLTFCNKVIITVYIGANSD